MTLYKQFSTVESTMGKKSHLATTDEKGNALELPLSPLMKPDNWGRYSFTGLVDNDLSITAQLNALSAEGWQLVSTNTISPTNTYLVITRYILKREVAD